MIQSQTLDQKLKSFACTECGQCCRQDGFVYLKDGEAEKIAGFLKLGIYDFTAQYCDFIDKKLVLKKLPNETCIFLVESKCQVHSAKPRQCRDFPVKWRTVKSFDYCEGMKKLGIRPDSDEKTYP